MGKYKDLVSGICGLIFSVALYAMSVQIGMKESSWIGAGFVPQIAAVIMFVTFGFITYRGAQEAKAETEEKDLGYTPNYKGVAVLFLAMLVYAALLKSVGFIITSIIFLFFAICMMTKKENIKPVKYGIITVITVLFIYFIFTEVFGIRIPNGIL